MTLHEVEQLVPGTLITTYHSGFWEFVSAEPFLVSECDMTQNGYVTDAFKICYGTPVGKSKWEIGDIYTYLLSYKKRYSSTGKPVNGKELYSCISVYCQIVTPDLINQMFKKHTDIQERLKKII